MNDGFSHTHPACGNAHTATDRLPIPAAESPFRRQTTAGNTQMKKKKKKVKKKQQQLHSPGYGFFYGSCAIGDWARRVQPQADRLGAHEQ